jgi:predicted phosphodiesterase
MRILAFSDVHNNLACVRKMQAQEQTRFDAVLFGGDIGRKIPEQFFEILANFDCPIFYVYGNWDIDLSREKKYHPRALILHESFVTLDGVTFAGFSDKPSEASRRKLARSLNEAGVDLARTIMICHYELPRLEKDIPGLGLHLFGHTHQASQRMANGTRYANLGALDRQVTARPSDKSSWSHEDCRNYIAGNYAIIDIAGAEFSVSHVEVPHSFPNWTAIDRCYRGIEWIPEEVRWSRESDPKLPRFEAPL